MRIVTRKHGSQRTSKSVKLEVVPNFGGQGGTDELIFSTGDGRYLIIKPESSADVKSLMSAAHIIYKNFKPEAKNGSF